MNSLIHSVATSLQWLPNETLFSLCSRHHILSNNHKPHITCLQLFGHRIQGNAHDFPSRIDTFVNKTEGLLGNSDEIIFTHSLLPYYLHFILGHLKDSALDAMKGSGIGHLKWNLGILTSRFRANHPLKACLKCMDEDRNLYLTPYWHRDHQLPGVWICPVHHELLLSSTLKSTGVKRFFWHLPKSAELIYSFKRDFEIGNEQKQMLLNLASSSIALCNLDINRSFQTSQIVHCYLEALKQSGMMKNKSQLNLNKIGSQFSSFTNKIRVISELESLPKNSEEAITFIRKMTSPRTGTHPLRHLIWINWLFGTWEKFIDSYENPVIPNKNTNALQSPNENESPLKNLLISHIKIDGWSITRTAKQLGIDVSTAQAWAADSGISTPTRASKMTTRVREKMIGLLKIGIDKETVAKESGLSVVTVTKLLRTEVGLSDLLHLARFNNAQKSNREIWTKIVVINPNLGVRAVRMLEPSAYIWLYRHDQSWLNKESEKLQRLTRQNHSNTKWDERDLEFSKEVKEISLQIFEENPNQRIQLWMIYQKLPNLKAKLSKLDKLPLTKLAISNALNYKIIYKE